MPTLNAANERELLVVAAMENAMRSAANVKVDAINLVKKPHAMIRNGQYVQGYVLDALRHAPQE